MPLDQNVLQMGQAPQFGAMPVTIGIPGGFNFVPEYNAYSSGYNTGAPFHFAPEPADQDEEEGRVRE